MAFEQLWEIACQLQQRLASRFDLQPQAKTQDLQNYYSNTKEACGSLQTFASPEIAWLVHSWLRIPATGFSNIRLTVWLGAQIRVPHLVFEFATTPNLFFYMDYIPRADLLIDSEYFERYYKSVNSRYLEIRDNPSLSQFVSKDAYIRQFQSPNSLCYTSSPNPENILLLKSLAQEMLERWLIWVEQADSVPETEQFELGQRDFLVRRNSAEKDPGNQAAVRLFGEEFTAKLVSALWGG